MTNALLGKERVIVSDMAGTTRDSIDTHWKHDGTEFVLIDTAGMRRKGKIDLPVERYSVVRACGLLTVPTWPFLSWTV